MNNLLFLFSVGSSKPLGELVPNQCSQGLKRKGAAVSTSMDWTHPVIVDAIWSRLASFEWMWRNWTTIHTRGILRFPCRVRNICRTIRHELPWTVFWTEMQRSYWTGDVRLMLPSVYMEMRLRRLVWELYAWGKQNSIPITVAGGFATWQRAAAQEGQEALQRLLWQPGDVDLFVSRILKESELEDIRLIYSRFANAEGSLPYTSVRFSNSTDAYYSMKEELAEDASFIDLQSKFEALDLLSPAPSVDEHSCTNRIVDALLHSPMATPRSLPILNVSRFFGPRTLSLNLIETGFATSWNQYAHDVMSTFDLLPSAISVDVEENGEWRFRAFSEKAEESIIKRQLRFTTSLFVNEERLLKTLVRGMKYRGYGFE